MGGNRADAIRVACHLICRISSLAPILVADVGNLPPDARRSRTLATVLWSSPSSLAIWRLPVVGVSFSSSTKWDAGKQRLPNRSLFLVSLVLVACRPSHRWRIPSHRPGPAQSTAQNPAQHGFPELAESPEQADQAKKYKSADLIRSIMQGNSGRELAEMYFSTAWNPPCCRLTTHRTTGARKWTVAWRHGETLVSSFARVGQIGTGCQFG